MTQWHGGDSRNDFAGLDVFQNAAFGNDFSAIPDLYIVSNGYLATNLAARTNLNTTGDAGLSENCGVRPNFDIMRNMDSIIDFNAVTNNCFVKRGSINHTIGPYFYIFSHTYDTNLRNL